MSTQTAKLIIDIETIGEDFDAMDEKTQDVLTRYAKATASSEEEYQASVERIKGEMGLSPLTGSIASIGLFDYHKDRGIVLFQAPGEEIEEYVKDDITYRAMTEKKMLASFWQMARDYDHFITFNGRRFDVPFMLLRSAINGIRVTKDLMRGRYLYQQNANAVHIDLYDQLTFYGATMKKGSLHMYTRAFGITSPKEEGVDGGDVGAMFKDGKYKEIAEYNGRDLFATRDLYTYWNDYLRF